MRDRLSLGMVETWGMVGAVEAADVGTKAADVAMLGYELNRAGFVTVKFVGDVAAVKAAVEAASAAAGRVAKLVASHVIPRPDGQVAKVSTASPDNVPPLVPPPAAAPATPTQAATAPAAEGTSARRRRGKGGKARG